MAAVTNLIFGIFDVPGNVTPDSPMYTIAHFPDWVSDPEHWHGSEDVVPLGLE
jgi:hypothetical protein